MGYQQPPLQTPSLEAISKAMFDDKGDPALESYNSWLKRCPSALDVFECMMKPAKGKQVVVFLDYDGTLSPIVEDPDQAFMSSKMRSAVHEVAKMFPTAIVSGRGRDKVNAFVQLKNVIYAGSHGMDISTPSGSLKYQYDKHQRKSVDQKGDEVVYFQPAQDFLPAIREIFKILQEKTKTIKGAMVEDNKFCISVHFRRVNEKEVDTLMEIVKSTMNSYSNFRISEGKKVMEIRPRIEWDKGRALDYLLDTLGFDNSSDFLPLYIGDDKTDEDAFKAIRNIGRGYPIIVSSIPKDTKALYSLRDTEEVMCFLTHLTKWRRSSHD